MGTRTIIGCGTTGDSAAPVRDQPTRDDATGMAFADCAIQPSFRPALGFVTSPATGTSAVAARIPGVVTSSLLARRMRVLLILFCFLGGKPAVAADASPTMPVSAPASTSVAAAASTPASAPAGVPTEYQLKSAFIYNFANFIDWPDDIGKRLQLCAAVPDEAMKYFGPLDGKSVGDRTLTVRHLGEADSAGGCRILYVSGSDDASLNDWLSEVGDEEVLTISESGDWLKKGVVMNLLLQDGRVTFDVNMEAARGENIVISSRLLRLARTVYGLDAVDERSGKKP